MGVKTWVLEKKPGVMNFFNEKNLSLGMLVAVLGLTALLPLVRFYEISWYDQHRIGQIFIFFLVGVFFLLYRGPYISFGKWGWAWGAVIALGMLSSALSPNKVAGFTEVGLLVCSIGLATFIATLHSRWPTETQFCFLLALRLTCYGLVLQFWLTYLAALSHPDLYFHPWMLIDGFSNVRFQGQFFTMALPVLLVATWGEPTRYSNALRALDTWVVLSGVCMVVIAGTRGTLAAWAIASAVFAFGGPNLRRIAVWMVACVLGGLLLAPALMEFLPGGAKGLRTSVESLTGLSSREVIWGLALDAIRQNPWLGIGPMGFSDIPNKVAAHPHQAFLQIAAEWGMLCFIIIFLIIYKFIYNKIIKISRRSNNEIFIYSFICALIQSMVDGIAVTPYSQVFISFIIGIIISGKLFIFHKQNFYRIIYAIFFITLSLLTLKNVGRISKSDFLGQNPRFWAAGSIKKSINEKSSVPKKHVSGTEYPHEIR